MNVKQGDLAIMIRSKMYPEHVGLIVTVDKFIGGVDALWGCSTSKPIRLRDMFTGIWGQGFRLAIPDANLKPVSGLPDTDDVDESTPIVVKEEETA